MYTFYLGINRSRRNIKLELEQCSRGFISDSITGGIRGAA
jgi:hypothetical protein